MRGLSLIPRLFSACEKLSGNENRGACHNDVILEQTSAYVVSLSQQSPSQVERHSIKKKQSWSKGTA